MTTLKQAMEQLAASGEAPELDSVALQPSKLGTKDHWDRVYEREVKMFKEIGDEGEVWFGEDSAEKMVDWAEDNLPSKSSSILDVGTGNGQLLFTLSSSLFTSLTGIDYSPSSISLATSIASARSVEDPLASFIKFQVADILSESAGGLGERKWDCVMDKGTYDAICLSDEMREGRRIGELYPTAVSSLVGKGGFFLITSCNWTRKELEKAFITPETGLIYHSHVPRPSFSFGGSSGSSITTIAFVKE
ncbi:S-adenosyl-L-methionine-dependent methyltransferase [Leucosporidium creatinivorum]|uniref:Protein-lysine N-methyltransferase EFM4 n=1 Tax=Leucosporidium creatinivorum TaxID=106004 RepID=A0A1Y2C2S4_9BASI|nr:S-adenosyl-L-methionine-dependent methyltransferase [Leucosporidium creatinivorum]